MSMTFQCEHCTHKPVCKHMAEHSEYDKQVHELEDKYKDNGCGFCASTYCGFYKYEETKVEK